MDEPNLILLAGPNGAGKSTANVAFESTLASRTFAPWIRELRKGGYQFHLFYFWLPSADACIKRVYERKSLGGHFVSEGTIRRRYHGGIRNFFELYRPIATRWHVFNNTQKPRRLIATGGENLEETVLHRVIWDRLKEEHQHHG